MPNSESAPIALADRFWNELLELEPIIGTEVGDERFDDRLPDPSEEGLARQETVYRSALADLRQIDRAELDEMTRTTLDVLEAVSRRQLGAIEHRTDRFAAVSHLFGPGNLLAELGTLQRADTPERLERYLARLAAIPRYLGELGNVAEDAARRGQVSPALVVDRAITQVERLLAGSPADSPAVNPVPEGDQAGRERVLAALREHVWPAYGSYVDMLKRYRPSARDTIAISAIEGGDAIYAYEILAWTTLALDPKEVHETGLEQLALIQEERRQIAASLGFSTVEEALEDYRASGRDTAGSREEMLQVVRDQVQRSWDAAPRFFGRLPNDNCEVRMVEEFREADMPGAFYLSPSGDGSRRGVYYVNTYQVGERQLHSTATTSYHEANPGHHFQISLEQEHEDRPPLRRFGSGFVGASFSEGWGLYSERLADEMGLFLDEYERLGMLEAQGFRAARLIVDTGIHALGWDRDRAVRQMVETGAARVDSEIEVDRYVAMPGQALAYMIGQLEIQRWRQAAKDRKRSGFSLQHFHDRLLAIGSLPLAALERELNEGGW